MLEYLELQEFVEDIAEDEEVKAKRLGTPPQFGARTIDGDISSDPAFYQSIPKDDIVAELIAHGTHATVLHQQIDTLWRLYDQAQKEIEQLRAENAHLQNQMEHSSQAPSVSPGVRANTETVTSLANAALPRLKQPPLPRQDPAPARETREGSAATDATGTSQSGKRSAEFLKPPQLTDGTSPTFRKWVMQIENKFKVDRDHFDSDQAKVAYIVDRVDGEAYDLIESYLEADHRSTPSELIQLLSKRFNDPHRRFKAKDQLAKLAMKPFGDFSTHVSEFVRLANIAQLTREQWKEDLHNTLFSKLKSSMILYRTNSHVDFEEYCNIAQEMAYGLQQENEENRERRERRENTKQRQQTRNSSASNPPQASSSPTAPSAKAQGTQGDQKLRSEIKCYTCGKKGHIAPNCPEKKSDTAIRAVGPEHPSDGDDLDSDSEN
jgi:Zinc knuckle